MTRRKKLRLKRKWCFVLGMVSILVLINITNKAVDFYSDYLHRCDLERGYTCNIFGK